MWGLTQEWLSDIPVSIPDSDSLHSDLCGAKYKFDSNSRLVMESKADMKSRGVRSSDEADALCLTFAMPITAAMVAETSTSSILKELNYDMHTKMSAINRARK